MDDAFRSGFASALLDVLFNRLADFIASEMHMILNVDESLRKLDTSMREALHLLNMVDQFQGNDALRRRADEVAGLCYDVDDLIDDIDHEIKKQKSASWSRNPVLQAVKPAKNWFKPRKIVELRAKLAEITEDLKRNVNVSQPEVPITSDGFFSSKQQLKLVGRDGDISVIVKELTCLDKSDSIGVSIVGMRGVGKTALAYDILNHEEVKAKFPLILRASMGGKSFNGAKMVAELVVVHDKSNTRALNGHPQNNLLARDGWLLLIDDLSEVSTMAWRDFHTCYLMNKGRKLLLTTLNPNFAKMAQTNAYYLKPLSNEHCRELVARELSLFHNGYVISPHVCDTLAKMSGGLPLVATFLGWSQARRVKGKDHMFVEEDLWNWPTFRKQILPILRSTFLSLEPHLKRCFVYLSLFSQGYQFEIEELILLWIGEGLVQPCDSRLDENGQNNFRGLLDRSILQPLPANDLGLIRYEMHKLTHNCAQAAGSKTYVRLNESESRLYGLSANTRHLSFYHDIQPHFWDEVKRFRGLRTFLSLYDHSKICQISKIPRDLFKKVSRLRVLSLNKTQITELPDTIDRLKNLRYLDISKTPIKRLPETLSNLSTLQILKLKKDHVIPQLPKNFHVLTSLVFLDWDKRGIRRLQPKPCNIGKLISLRSLPLFIVGNKEGYRITELKDMKHLQGSICISNLEKVKDEEEAKEARLSSKSSLERLELEWTTLRNDANAGNVLEGLKPHDSLKELQIVNYGFRAFPLWLSHSLPMLETLHLESCNCIDVPSLGELPALKVLHLKELSKLKDLDHNFNGRPINGTVGCFPALELLVLHGLAELQAWTGLGANDMLHLRELEITDCPSLTYLPSLTHLTSLVDLRIERCEVLSSLPELPASLQSLNIRDSDLVKNRCQVGGDDWPKVDCVLKVLIDGIEVPTSVAQCIHSPNPEPSNYTLKGFQSITNGIKSLFGRLP